MTFKISGTAGHGSLLLANTAGEKLHYILDKMMQLRWQQVARLENNPELTIGDVTTINLTRIGGGVQSNVVPPLLTAGFDVRLALDVVHEEFFAQVSATIYITIYIHIDAEYLKCYLSYKSGWSRLAAALSWNSIRSIHTCQPQP